MSVLDWLNVPSLVGSALGATLFGWLGAYVAVKGKNFATRQDVEFLRIMVQCANGSGGVRPTSSGSIINAL